MSHTDVNAGLMLNNEHWEQGWCRLLGSQLCSHKQGVGCNYFQSALRLPSQPQRIITIYLITLLGGSVIKQLASIVKTSNVITIIVSKIMSHCVGTVQMREKCQRNIRDSQVSLTPQSLYDQATRTKTIRLIVKYC